MANRSTTQQARIGLVTWSLPGGGVETYLLRLATYLSAAGYAVEIVTTEAPGAWFHRIAATGAVGHHIDRAGSTQFRHAHRVGDWLAGREYDILFNSGSRHAHAAAGMLPERTAVIPVLHADLPYVYQTFCANARAWNAAVAVSPRVREVAQRHAPSNPILYIPNGVAVPGEEKVAQRATLTSPVRLLYLGRLEDEQKGILRLPAILQRCRERGIPLSLTIAGDGPDRRALERGCAEAGIADACMFLGMVPQEQVYPLLFDAHLLLMPSRYEGLPTVLLEAQACGCVPIASLLPGITDVALEDGVTGLLAPVDDIEAFADAIEALAGDPESWQAMSRAAHARAAHLFSTEAMGAAYVQLIEDALAGRYPRTETKKRVSPINRAILGYPTTPAEISLYLLKLAYRYLAPPFAKRWFQVSRESYNAKTRRADNRLHKAF